MSVMCRMNESCSTTKGLCIHEKMMMGVALLMAFAAIAHWVLHWF